MHQNIAFRVHPDPVSGMHCRHQFRPVKPQLEAYALPDDERTRAARAAARQPRPGPDSFAELVDWSPAEVWGAVPAR